MTAQKESAVLGGRFHADVASDGLPPNPGDPMAPHFTLLEAVVIQLLSILPTAHPLGRSPAFI